MRSLVNIRTIKITSTMYYLSINTPPNMYNFTFDFNANYGPVNTVIYHGYINNNNIQSNETFKLVFIKYK